MSLLNKIRKESEFSRVYAEVTSVYKKNVNILKFRLQKGRFIVKSGVLFGGLRARLSRSLKTSRLKQHV